MGEIVKNYQKGDFTIVWKPGLCMHAAECVKRLPEVYNPDEKPWIKPENAEVAALKEQINACPSGALTYKEAGVEAVATPTALEIEMAKDGPILVKGSISIKHSDGSVEQKDKMTALCRCGNSSNKPYCDGSHRKVGFTG